MASLLRKNIWLIFILVLFLSFYFFVPSLYFSQDDFFHLKVSNPSEPRSNLFSLFYFRSYKETGIYFYRPIFREFLFNIYSKFFGLNPLPFRITQLFIHLINIVLTYILVVKISKDKIVGIIASLFFAISAANVGVLSYLAGGIQASGMTMFALLTLILFWKFLESGRLKYSIFSFFFYLLSLASHELAMTLPFIMMSLLILKKGFEVKNRVSKLLPFFIASLILLLVEVFFISLPIGEKQYGFSFSPARILNSYVWYFVWSLGMPEMLLDFIGPGIKFNPNLMKFWGDYFKIIFPLFIFISLLLLISLKNLFKQKLFWFFVFWFVVSIAPVVFLPLHRSTYYLALSLPALSGIIGLSFSYFYKWSKSLSYFFIISAVALSFVTILLSQKTYWAITRTRIAKRIILDIRKEYPQIPKGAIIYIKNDPSYLKFSEEWGGTSKQASVILSGSDALQLIYHDPTLKVFYEDLAIPRGVGVLPFTAKMSH